MENCKTCKRETDDIHTHHIVPRSHGGDDSDNNLIRICSDCHFKIHHPNDEDGDIDQFSEEYRDFIKSNLFSEGWGIIPNKVLRDNSLTSFARILYCELSSLSAKTGYCWASNKYLANKFSVHPDTISKTVSSLSKYLVFEDRGGDRRRIWVHTITGKPRRKRRTNVDENAERNNIKKNTKDTDATSVAFSLEDTLKKWESGSVRRMDILAWYFRKAKFVARTKKELDNLIHRHIRAATRLEVYTDEELVSGWKKSVAIGEKLNFAPTLETVLKQLTQ